MRPAFRGTVNPKAAQRWLAGAFMRRTVRCSVAGITTALFSLAASAQEQPPRAIVPQDAGPTATPPAASSDRRVVPLRENEAPDRRSRPDQERDIVAGTGGIPPGTGPFVIQMPYIAIVGKPPVPDAVITMPELSIIAKPREPNVVINMPDIVIVGKRDEPDEDKTDDDSLTGGLGETSPTGGNLPSSSDSKTETPEEALPAEWCLGRYTAHAGRGTGTASGIPMPVGQVEKVPATVTAAQCRQTLKASIAGATVTLERTNEADTYAGTINMGDGAARVLTLTCGADLNLRGSLVAADANIQITRPVWLIRDPEGAEPLPPGC